jgi:hypothetical protein
VAGARRQEQCIAGASGEGLAGLATKLHGGFAPGDGKGLMGFRVIVGEGIDAVAPGRGPAVALEQLIKGIFGFLEGLGAMACA